MNVLCGLANLGNTCYLNATLQILLCIDELNHYLLNIINIQNLHQIHDSFLTKEWIQLFSFILQHNNSTISPNRFIEYSKEISKRKNREEFSGFEQNDANDYFYFIIESFHNSLNKLDSNIKMPNSQYSFINKYIEQIESKDSSIIPTLFQSCLLYNYINLNDGNKEFHKIEHGYTIELSIPSKDNITIYDCFNETFKDDILNEENAWFDEKTNTKKDVIKKTRLCYLPTILSIHLKRWTYTLHKNNKFIDIPINLDLKKFTIETNDDLTTYQLFGIINHMGNINGGHYTSYIRRNNRWFLIDDTQVIEVEERNIIHSKNYCLFYRKIK